MPLCERRFWRWRLGSGYAVVAVGVASLRERGRRVGGVGNKLLDAVETDVEAAVQDGGGVVGR